MFLFSCSKPSFLEKYNARPGQWQINRAAANYASSKVDGLLERARDRLLDRPTCAGCTGALACAAAQLTLEDTVPTFRSRRIRSIQSMLPTLRGLGIIPLSGTDSTEMCFKEPLEAIRTGRIMTASERPYDGDPLQPGTLVWTTDRLVAWTSHAVDRLNSGQRI